MLEQLKIENFRCFKYFELNHLGKVNLIVGENNCGKTSILEALNIYYSNSILKTLKQIMKKRGEYFEDSQDLNASFLFCGHNILLEEPIRITEIEGNISKRVEIAVKKHETPIEVERIRKWIKQRDKPKDIPDLEEMQDALISRPLELAQEPDADRVKISQYISSQGRITENRIIGEVEIHDFKLVIESNNQALKTMFIMSYPSSYEKILELFNQIVLTPEENLVYQALQIIEPNIERIAPIGNQINSNSHGSFFVRLKDTQKRVPIGSMGDGIWRMLGLSLALVSAKDGVLLVDEIDTGLHYTALEDMWKLIWETSKKLNVQVFATTHNSDCWKALEALTSREDVAEEDISIQRIEKDAPRSVAYNKKEIATAVARETEVR